MLRHCSRFYPDMLIPSLQNISDVSDDDISPSQLEDVQAYLESLRLGMIPDPRSCTAWDGFYEHHAPLIRSYVATFHLTAAERDDCIQEVWKDLVVQLGEFRHDPRRARLSTWL